MFTSKRILTGVLSAAVAAASLAQTAKPNATPAPADHHERKPDDIFRVKALSGGVYVLYGRGGNVGFFVGPEAVTVIDSEFADIAPGIVAEIKKVTDRPIKYLINTHHHGDHTGGNEVFGHFAVIVAQDNVRKRMLAAPATILREYPAELEEAKKSGDEKTAAYLAEQIEWAKKARVEDIPAPTLTFDSELRIHPGGGETIEVWHLPPAHTDGDSVVYFDKANVLHMGDDFFNGIIPFIDVQSGGSAHGYLAALDKVIARVPPDVIIIPGHGEVTGVAGLKAFRQYVADVIAAAVKAKAAGQSKEEFLRSVDLPAYAGYNGYKDRFKSNAEAAWDEAAGH